MLAVDGIRGQPKYLLPLEELDTISTKRRGEPDSLERRASQSHQGRYARQR